MSSQIVRPRGSTSNIFINYRREDSSGHAGRLFDALGAQFSGRLFMDIDTLEPGVDFVDAIEQAVGSCEVLIVIIGREWLDIQDRTGHRRLDDPGDFVRLELESALARKIRVIPVLVQDAPMPRTDQLPPSLAPLARRNAIELSDARWSYDVDRLAHTLQEILDENKASAAPPGLTTQSAAPIPPVPVPEPAPPARPRAWLLSFAALGLVAAGVVAFVLSNSAGTRATAEDPRGGKPEAPLTTSLVSGPGPQAPSIQPDGKPTEDPAQVPSAPEPDLKPAEVAAKVPLDPDPKKPSGRLDDGKPAKVPSDSGRKTPSAHPDGKPADLAAKIPFEAEPEPKAPHPDRAAAEPPRVTITAPGSGAKVGQQVQVQGTAFGLGDHRIFLCIRQPSNGVIYSRGEVVRVEADGKWQQLLRSSREKTFDILVVATSTKEAGLILNDQKSRDDGLKPLPAGASICSGAVTVNKQSRFFGIGN